MSIEHTGPKAYDYQYLATTCGAISALSSFEEVFAIFPEKPGGEDAEITVKDGSVTKTYEIQVKSHAGAFNLAALTDVLCHFPAYKSTDNLLQRLIDQPQTHLIVITGGRCNEPAAVYACKAGDFEHIAKNVQLNPLLPLIAAFNEGEKTKLKEQRAKYCQAQSKNITGASFLDKLQVWENLSADEMIAFCRQQLFEAGIPILQTGIVLEKILKLVKTGRDERSDIAQRLKELLQSHQQIHPAFDNPYVERPDERTLLDHLEQHNSLLLCGRSLCGKSATAKALAKHFTKRHYEFTIAQTPGEAERFLIDTNTTNRICILDDPMGHFYQPLESDQIWIRIKQLVNNIPSGKKLIVTANNDVLTRLQVSAGKNWVDLTATDKNFISALLDSYAKDRGLSDHASAHVRTFIANSTDERLIQPGQLDYLVNNWNDDYLTADTDLYEIAATDADRIAATIRQRGPEAAQLYRVLGLSSDVNTGVAVAELAYILADEETYPGVFKKQISTVSFADLLKSVAEDSDGFPVYTNQYSVTMVAQTELDFFVQCGFISQVHPGLYQFRHPLYYEAAKLLLREAEARKVAEMLKFHKKAVATLSPQTSLIAGRQIEFVFKHLDEAYRKSIIEIALFAVESIFPAVQDVSLIFLSANFPYLNEEQEEDVQRDLVNYHFDSSSLCWHKGSPFRPKDHSFQQSPVLLFKTISDDEFEYTSNHLLDPANPLPTAEEAWWYVLYIRKHSKLKPLQIDELILNRLMNYNEAFIRSIAAYQIFSQYEAPPKPLADRVFNDPHPFVIYQGIKGFVRGWTTYNQRTKNDLLPEVLTKLAIPQIVVAATNFLTQFGIGYASHSFDWKYEVPEESKKDMWNLWPQFMEVFFKNAPVNLRFNANRFLSTVDTGLKFLAVSELPSLLMNWIRWMKKSTVYMTYDTVLFSVNSYYFTSLSKLTATERLEFANELLFGGSTNFIAESLRYYLAYWDELTPAEQTIVVELLQTSGEAELLKAIALTGKGRPALIQEFITGQPGWDQQTVSNRIKSLPERILHKCLAACFLSYRYMDISNRDRLFWNSMLGYFIDKPENVLCKLALKILLDDLGHGIHELKETWGDPKTLVDNLLNEPGLSEYIFYLLLEDLAETTCSNTVKRWQLLIAKTDADFHTEIKKQLAKAIERIEMHDNFRIVYQLFGDDIFTEMPLDGGIRIIVNTYRKYGQGDVEMLQSVEKMFNDVISGTKVKLRLGGTYDQMISFLKTNIPHNTALLTKMEGARHDYYNQIPSEPVAEIKAKVLAPFEFMDLE